MNISYLVMWVNRKRLALSLDSWYYSIQFSYKFSTPKLINKTLDFLFLVHFYIVLEINEQKIYPLTKRCLQLTGVINTNANVITNCSGSRYKL